MLSRCTSKVQRCGALEAERNNRRKARYAAYGMEHGACIMELGRLAFHQQTGMVAAPVGPSSSKPVRIRTVGRRSAVASDKTGWLAGTGRSGLALVTCGSLTQSLPPAGCLLAVGEDAGHDSARK